MTEIDGLYVALPNLVSNNRVGAGNFGRDHEEDATCSTVGSRVVKFPAREEGSQLFIKGVRG